MLRKLLKEKILILDGATGTAIQKFGLTEKDFRGQRFVTHPVNLKGNNDILNLTKPEVIQSIHRSYIEAGADIIETNTFNSNAISQEEYHCSELVYTLNYEGARLAKQTASLANRPVFVAGSIGPTSKTLSLSPDVNHPEFRPVDFDTLTAAYTTQINGLIDGGADLLLIETVFITAVLAYVAVYVSRAGSIDAMLTTLTTFAVAAMRMLPSVNRINTYLTEIAYTQPGLDYLYENLQEGMKADAEIAERKANSQKEKLVLEDKIMLDHITFHYPNTDTYIFRDAHMEVPKGKSVGIVGTSGAGKSTIVDILLGLLHAQEGEITCDGTNIFKNYESWLAQIGYIPQSIYLVDESIRDNIAFGIDEDLIDDKRIWNILEEAQLKEFVEGLPEGLDTTIGDRGIRLSGGQRQRIGIARALYHDPEILVFDEATSALDNDTEAAVMEAINSFHGRKTMIIIAHRLNTIEKCDMIYRVENQKLVEIKNAD